jgi:hypothetical protein
MNKNVFLLIAYVCFVHLANAQKFYTKNGATSFFSSTKLEDIKAENNQVTCVLVSQTGELQFSMLNKGFHFDKALMEEHFNENYMESNKFPKSTFKGAVAEIAKVNFTKDGNYPVSVKGDLTIHGVTKNITTTGNITVKGGKPTTATKFSIKLSDYGIKISNLHKNNIADNIEITVNCLLDQKL